jgi:broad specificity phosphatase PhoE
MRSNRAAANKERPARLLSSEQARMDSSLPAIYIARHGETAWTLTGQHTGLTDLPLTQHGEDNAMRLGDRLAGLLFAKVFTSPLQRARRTCDLAGFRDEAEIDNDLLEWNYGQYEGRLTADIRAERPGWQLFRDGCPGGESPAQVRTRADNAIARIRSVGGNVLIFSSGHFIRMLAARWIGIEPSANAMSFLLDPSGLSVVGYDSGLFHPVIRLWNDTNHVRD